jgi:hypothetical protein
MLEIVPAMMPQDEQVGQWPAPPQPASEAGPGIPDRCRAARIDDVAQFANCLVETITDCPHRFAFSAFRYCVHPQREVIIARTLAAEGSPT